MLTDEKDRVLLKKINWKVRLNSVPYDGSWRRVGPVRTRAIGTYLRNQYPDFEFVVQIEHENPNPGTWYAVWAKRKEDDE